MYSNKQWGFSFVHIGRLAELSIRGVYLIKVCYDLVEKTEALQSFLIDIRLCIKLFEVRDGGEHHTHRLV